MLFEICHVTRYTYSKPVTLLPQTLRFRPRDGGGAQLRRYSVELDPKPAGRSAMLDVEGNAVEIAWFSGQTDHFTVTARLSVEMTRVNPFDFLIEPGGMPINYGAAAPLLIRELTRGPVPAGDPVGKLALEVAVGHETPLDYLTALTHAINAQTETKYRETGAPYEPAETLEKGGGACRDLATLFIDAARSRGIACRFVSGYTSPPEGSDGEPELHAWAECYLPGGGWRAFDPTRGLAVADRHVPVSASTDPQFTMPVTGSVAGDAETEIDFDLQVRMTEGPVPQLQQ